jgi:hypothetical protein
VKISPNSPPFGPLVGVHQRALKARIDQRGYR